MKILVVNCGSSSIKFQLFEMPQREVCAKGLVERIGEPGSVLEYHAGEHHGRHEVTIRNHTDGLHQALDVLFADAVTPISDRGEIAAVGHRVVHGGEAFSGSVVIDEEVLATISQCADLAPLHNPANLAGIEAAMAVLPEVPHVACFDTAFHATMPPRAYMYALPYEVYTRFRVRRYGFHGTSHRYVTGRAAEQLGIALHKLNCITCHLGNGASITAVEAGRSVDTSMGMTPLEGLMMGTRCGDCDPAVVLYLVEKGYDVDALNKLFNKHSGLLGISGISNDVRVLLEQAAQGHARSQLALDMFCYRVKKYIGAYVAALNRVDALVFTGGIGEHAASVRTQICQGLGNLGVILDDERNTSAAGNEQRISAADSPIQVLVIPTDEEGIIAADTYQLVTKGP